MAQQKKSKQKVVKGSGGLKTAKKPNKFLVIALVIAVAIAGGLLVFQSSAGSYLFVLKYQNMSGGYVGKANGVQYRIINRNQSVSGRSAKYLTRTGYGTVCAHFRLFDSKGALTLRVGGNTVRTEKYANRGTYNICSVSKVRFTGKYITVTSNGGKFGVDTIYAKP